MKLQKLFGLQHRNAVQLRGCCACTTQVLYSLEGKCVWTEMRERLLCFEYVPDKSIREHISDVSCGIERRERYDMTRGIFSGLNYLHTERDIDRMDLRPKNIFLDDNILPNIADFGLSRLFGKNGSRIITTSRAGTL
ncbi:hypothetical protein HU200_038880 [Digitaria exilis]|uniref:Protein kinase domain-containing protein n=1 Tax=Digitaria exilis TaxID=1010633 RepID=A0A835EIT6_9POAL|nr:hypothetical protein HU200_038880 [Digitaria exilis]